MKLSRLYIVSLLLLTIVALGAVSASEDLSADIVMSEETGELSAVDVADEPVLTQSSGDDNIGMETSEVISDSDGSDESIAANDDSPMESSLSNIDDVDELSESSVENVEPALGDTAEGSNDAGTTATAGGTFKDIQTLVDNANSGGVINLEKGTYTGNGKCINVTKSLTFNGNGAVLDAKGLSNIFQIYKGTSVINVVLKNLTLKNSKHDNAAIYSIKSNLKISDCKFTGCSATKSGSNGGAIYFHQGGTLNVTHCSFASCSSKNLGGAIYTNGKKNFITFCTFNKCASKDGASLYLHNRLYKGVSTVTSCNFTNGAASLNSGGVYSDAGDSTIKNCIFSNCKAKTKNGGAIRSYEDVCRVINCNFTGCYAGGNSGGAFYSHGGTVSVVGCNFDKNTCPNNGGSIRLFEAKGTIKNCVIKNSKAKLGGAICSSEKSRCTIVGCKIQGSNATQSGGGVYCTDVCAITNTVFTNCQAKLSGGAVAYSAARGNVKGCTFTNCHADGSGGAFNSYKSTCNVISGKFTNCKAKVDGGASFSANGKNDFRGCTFNKCTAGLGAALRSYDDVCTATSCKFISCKATNKNSDAVYNVDCKKCSFSPRLSYTIKIGGGNAAMLYTSGRYLAVRIFKKNRPVPAGKAVSFVINGKGTKVNTDSRGYAKIKITYPPGTYNVLVTCGGVGSLKKVVVKHILASANYKVKRTAKQLVLTGRLVRVNGKVLSGKTIAFRLNGRTYKAVTNRYGIAQVTIKSNILRRLKVQRYDLQMTYMKDTIKRTVNVVK